MTITHEADLDRVRLPAEALETILSLTPTLPIERVPIVEAAWRVLAEDIVAPENHPPFPASTMDGFAVMAEDDSPWREVIGVQAAGSVLDVEVTPGTAVQIMTGAPLPRGADAVVRVENTETADDHVIVHQESINPGENIRPVGTDIAAGELVLAAGTTIGPPEIGLLASLGFDPVPVRKRPVISIVSTGDELLEPSMAITPGKIRDSNRFSLLAALQQTGAIIDWMGKGPDDRDHLYQLLTERIAASDVVITSGGVSMGELDIIKSILGDLAEVHFRRVFLKPGKPLNFATAGETLIFGLPGNPVSALVSFELFLRPALRSMMGYREVTRPAIEVVLAHDVQPTDRIEYQRAVVSQDESGRLVAVTTGVQASSRLASLTGANALVIIPPREQHYAAGEAVQATLTGELQGR
jgi:molybdenum cofactor synthesis domain-containing protein